MPRFYFDSSDGGTWDHDDEGLVLPDLASARHEAIKAVTEVARDVLPGSAPGSLSILLRDEEGRPLLRMSLALTVETLA